MRGFGWLVLLVVVRWLMVVCLFMLLLSAYLCWWSV